MSGVITHGPPEAQELSKRMAGIIADYAYLKSLDKRSDGMRALVASDGSRWTFKQSSSLGGDDALVVAPTNGAGRWLREAGAAILRLPITFNTADAAVLLTTPAGCIWQPEEFAWEVTQDFTGGSSSAIGVSSTKATFTTKGDLLGGAAGDLAAALTTALSPNLGVIGTTFSTLAQRRKLWVATNNLRFDRIVSAFTQGAGAVLVKATIFQNLGA